MPRLLMMCLALALLALPMVQAGEFSDEFDRQRFKTAFQHEVAFREAALHVAWAAEPLCDDTNEIEPFVLWSLQGLRKGLPADAQKLFTQATGMDAHWRIAWLDEAAPQALQICQRVLAVNQRPLPAPGSTLELGALLRGGVTLSVDDQAFWAVMHQARSEANADSVMSLTLDAGQQVQVATQTGCAGTVTATAFDDEPQNFPAPVGPAQQAARQCHAGGLRHRLPGESTQHLAPALV